MPVTPTALHPMAFFGHGNPMHAITDNPWARGWRQMGALQPRPRAILCVSAHWETDGTWVLGQASPRTIHDFGGFPQALFEVHYPAPGAPDLAARIAAMLDHVPVGLDQRWGLDHGTWSVLRHAVPEADIPVLQLSMDRRRTPAEHIALGERLAPLRAEGVWVVASGNLTHNLRHAMQQGQGATPAWAASFDQAAAAALESRDVAWLARALESDTGRMAHPTPDHWWPLLYLVGAMQAGEAVAWPLQGFDMASLSMRSARVG